MPMKIEEFPIHAIDRCTGDYITFVDSDDIIDPDFVKQLVSDLEDTEADMAAVGVVKCKAYSEILFTKGESVTYEHLESLKQLFGTYEGFLCNKLYKRCVIQENQLHLEQDIAVCEDLLFNVKYLLKCKKAVYNNGAKYFYRQIGNSASNRLDNLKWFDALKAYQRILESVKEYPEVYTIAENRYAMFLCEGKYRIRFVHGNVELMNQINSEWKRIHSFWKNFSVKQRLKLYLFSIVPGLVVRYQRRKL